jgi:hypothetical protein
MNLIPEPNDPQDDDPAGRIVRYDDDASLVAAARNLHDVLGEVLRTVEAALVVTRQLAELIEQRGPR